MKKIIAKIVHWLNIFFIGLTIVLIFVAIFRPDLFEHFIEWMDKIVQTLGNWNYVVAFVSAFVESFPVIWVSVPGQNVMLLVGGFYAKQWPENLYIMIVVAIMWALLGNYVWYLLGRYYGDVFFERYGDWFGIGRTELKYMKKWIKNHGWWMVVVGKFHNVARAFIPFIAGSMGMKQRSFIIYNIIGSILRAVTIVLLGVVFVNYYKIVLNYIGYILIGIMALFALYIYFFKREEFKKYLKEKEKEIDDKLKEAEKVKRLKG